jgi:CRP/FNR family cyclic AMP-dependent transcriptional regulator
VYEDVLAQVPLFQSLTPRELQVLSVNCREREYPAGAVLLRQGETGVGLFIITAGAVHVTQTTPDGGSRELGDFGRGAVLGEMSLLDDMPRTATVVATEDTRALVIPVWDFRAALREAPDVSIKLLSVLSQRLRAVERKQQ